MPKQRSQRCNARTRRNDAALHRADREGRLMEYLRSSTWCRNWPGRGKKRCRLHGGLSTGPKTSEGKARTIAAMVEGRRRLLEKLKAEGKPVPWGRKRGGVNRPGISLGIQCAIPRTSDTEPAIELRLFSDRSRNIRRPSTIDVAHVVRASIRRRAVTHLRLCASLLCSSRLAYRHISRLKVPTASWARPDA
jgi:hypothetical protein